MAVFNAAEEQFSGAAEEQRPGGSGLRRRVWPVPEEVVVKIDWEDRWCIATARRYG